MASSIPDRTAWWVTRACDEVDLSLRMGSSGPGARQPKTVCQAFQDMVRKMGARPALHVKRPKEAKEWTHYSWQQYYDMCIQAAKSFVSIGLRRFQGVSIIGFNSPEWFIANMGCILAGGIVAGIYTTNLAEAACYIADHSESAIVVCEDKTHLAKFKNLKNAHIKAFVVWASGIPTDAEAYPAPIHTWSEFLNLGSAMPTEQLFAERIAPQTPSQCCTLIYTSGTTGNPKAVMISHDNVTWTANCFNDFNFNWGPDDHFISYLPLSHIAAQMADIHGPIATGSQVWFAQPDALRGSLAETLREVRPTVFFGVPRVWEKMMDAVKKVGASRCWALRALATWAKKKGALAAEADVKGSKDRPWFFGIAHSILNKVRSALGFDRCRLQLTGAAPITKETLDYFASLYLPIYEMFGMSECTGPQTFNIPGAHRPCSCGRAVPGTTLKLWPETQEICMSGRNVFMGYLKDPVNTSATIDGEGFLHSGDIGKIEDGYLSITGRIKELLITAGGENIPPVPIEDGLKAQLEDVVSNCMLIGDKRRFLSCLFTLKVDQNADGSFTRRLTRQAQEAAARVGSSAKTVEEAMACPKFTKLIEDGVAAANRKSTSNAQRCVKWTIVPDEFTIPEELTPTMKLKRSVVLKKYDAIVEEMYVDTGNNN
eukprot:gnl/Hemi2/8468_TR2929_c0_g1_i1.p1 gnl/Hemi2/8468_TR2929_c0_g1~~gnl/Hemi2/8468_TR2929_c0_g1_i1.p1  ORF type:complete len:656 (-),score=207.83 gnl/Hemi2/8468_TR2929_c0_g1_i1:111-2078(-)